MRLSHWQLGDFHWFNVVSYFGPSLLAAGLAASVSTLELTTSKYPRTFFLLKKAGYVWAYALIYALIGLAVTLGLRILVEQGTVKLEGLGLSSPWVQAIVVGLTVKAFLHIRLFQVTVGTQAVPVGIETLVILFEPWLLREIELAHFNLSREFIEARAAVYPDLEDVRERIRENVPSSFSREETAAFLADIDGAETPVSAMEALLNFLGRRTFDRIFPPSSDAPSRG